MTKHDMEELVAMAARYNEIRAGLCYALNTRLVTVDTVAESLRSTLPELSGETLRERLRLLLDGAAEWKKEFLRLWGLPESRLPSILSDAMERHFSNFGAKRYRQSLLVLFQILCADSGQPLDGVWSVYFANLPEEDLKRRVLALMERKGKELIGKAALFLSGHSGETGDVERGGFTEAEHEVILAAAIYAAQDRDGENFQNPKFLGWKIGLEHSMMERMEMVVREQRLSDVFDLLELASYAAALRFALETPLLSDTSMLLMEFSGEGHMLKLLLMTAFPLALTIADDLFSLSSPIMRYGLEIGNLAVSEIKLYFTEIEKEISTVSAYAEGERKEEDASALWEEKEEKSAWEAEREEEDALLS